MSYLLALPCLFSKFASSNISRFSSGLMAFDISTRHFRHAIKCRATTKLCPASKSNFLSQSDATSHSGSSLVSTKSVKVSDIRLMADSVRGAKEDLGKNLCTHLT